MPVPLDEITACRQSHARLHQTLAGLTDAAASAPSLLPEWTVAHVVAHLALNGDSVVRRLEGAASGRVIEQYEGGAAARDAAIQAGAEADASHLVADLYRADAAVEAVFATLPESAWDRPVLAGGGREVPAAHLAFARWREVETHHVDLGLGYGAAQWPQPLVDRWLPALLEGLSHRADQRTLMAWALGRGSAPALSPWG
ncbi:maleylpyruvate isomerase N-terminal domain-containing protein [Candidatus Blastococcus massiliensis]|uniref:maleylpyruvate isomerase N-terminal domain-containing protein n=1 Tax=Candidatus Blastococcus massiliensis TaxID=1470358 RepID=UPI0009DD3FC9